jgi:ankyrin repeat protein
LDKQLFESVERDSIEQVRSVLAGGADVNARDEEGATPLHRAVAAGNKEVIDLLIARGANVNATGGSLGGTPLCEAIAADYDSSDVAHKLYRELKEKRAEQLMLDIVRTLIAHGTDVNARDEFGGRVLGCALPFAPIEVVRLLLASGADPGLKDDRGTTALHEAVSLGYIDLVALFLDSGTNVDVRDKDQQTTLHEAVWRDNKEMVELLLARGADVNARDRRCDTPLHVAAVNGYAQLFDLLVLKSADKRAKNRQGLTPVGYARLMPPQGMIHLTPEGSQPYSVIITSVGAIRGFLQGRAIDYDQIWIPREVDIKRAETILNYPRKVSTAGNTEGARGREPVVSDLGGYSREYAGFKRGGAKFVLCSMNQCRPDMKAPENQFSGRAMDDWRGFVLAVIALDAGRVERLEWDGF